MTGANVEVAWVLTGNTASAVKDALYERDLSVSSLFRFLDVGGAKLLLLSLIGDAG